MSVGPESNEIWWTAEEWLNWPEPDEYEDFVNGPIGWGNLPGDLIYRVLNVYKKATASCRVRHLCKTLSQINKHWCFALNQVVNRLEPHLGVKGSELDRLLNRFRNLEKIRLHACTDEPLLVFAQRPYTYVKVLDLQGCQEITDRGILSLGKLISLRHLDLTNCVRVSDDGLMVLTNLVSLRLLNLRIYWPALKVVEASFPPKEFTYVGFRALGQVLTLRELSLKGRMEVDDSMLVELVGLTSLTSLKLTSTKITNKGLHGIACLRSLVCLKMACTNVTDEGFANLVHLTALKSLRISSCLHMTDVGLEAVGRITSLSKLLIGNAPLIKDVGVSHLTALTKLRYLVLGYCSSVTSEGFKSLSSLQSLSQLGFKSCPRVVTKELIRLRAEIPWFLKLRIFCF